MRTYDRAGMPISEEEWLALSVDGHGLIGSDELPSGHRVITTWDGLDHRSWFRSRPLIFLTLVLAPPGNQREKARCRRRRYRRRYATETEALAGHYQVLDVVRHDAEMRRLKGRQ